jgi:tight adherence protein B
MSLMLRIAAAVVAGASVFFLAQLLRSLVTRRSLSKIEIAYLSREESRRRTGRQTSLAERLRDRLARMGYDTTLPPVLVSIGLIYLAAAVTMRLLGFASLLALILSVPVTVGVTWIVVMRAANRRRAAFDRQLMSVLNQVSDQLLAGYVPQRAFETVVATVGEPLHSEMSASLAAAAANRDLVGELRLLSQRYPSRAFDLLIAALEVNEELGGSLEPSLRQSAAILSSGFELAEEAKAEVSQAKAEYYGILIVLSIIAFSVYRANTEAITEALSDFVGVLILAASLGWAALGVFVAQRMFAKVGSRT